MIYRRFRCPLCGGCEFEPWIGSNGKRMRSCRGIALRFDGTIVFKRCNFQWSESDDELWFVEELEPQEEARA